MKRKILTFGENGLYLTLQPILSPFAQTYLRTENVKLIYTTSFSNDRLSGYKFPTDLTTHLKAHQMEEQFYKLYMNYSKKRGGNFD